MKRGKLIVLEGVSGTGKETQAKLLQKFLKKKGIISRIVFHPSPELKPALRKAASVSEQIELLAQNREDTVRKVIGPAISRGEWVISLRNYVSAIVYQGDVDVVKNIDIQPDYLFYFDISAGAAMERVNARHKKTAEPLGKFETIELLNKKRDTYKKVLGNISHVTIDAAQSIPAIERDINKYLNILVR